MTREDDSTSAKPHSPFSTADLLASTFCRCAEGGGKLESVPHEQILRHIACDYGTHALVLEALIEMLVRKGIMNEDEFEAILREIDARDGKIDGTLGVCPYLGAGI